MLTKSLRWAIGIGWFTALMVVAFPVWRPTVTSMVSAMPAASTAGVAYVTTADIDAALRQMPASATTYDKPIKTVDTGEYKVTIVILRRVPGKTPDSSLSHERVTEVYHMLIGSGTFETGGTLVDGKPVDLTTEAAGPSTRGTIQGGETRPIAPGDNVVIPPGVPHRFSHIDGPITYLVTRIEAPRP
jgi:mannose-6-phosphate isomerase-like protein (cupin superfamily)